MVSKVITTNSDLDEIVREFDLNSDTVIIKPNWVGMYSGGYTDAKVIDLLLSSLKGRKVIFIESFTYWRTDKKRDGMGDYFSSSESTLETGKMHWDFFKKMDAWFLKETGIGDILKKHNAEYLNVTNEIWEGNTADPETIRLIVEKNYQPVAIKDMYENVPQKLLDLKGVPLISFAKAKIDSTYGLSASIKNIFGLIPDPNRYEKYHGGDPEKLLSRSIIDVHKIYQSLFDVRFSVESIYEYSKMDWEEGVSQKMNGNGRMIAGKNGYEVDIEAEKVYKSEMRGALKNLLKEYKNVFQK